MLSPLPAKLLGSLITATLLFLLLGLQSAFACPLSAGTEHNPASRVNICHLEYSPEVSSNCCESAVCHRSTTSRQHLGSPEFSNQIKDVAPLMLKSRQPAPQPKTGLPFHHAQTEHQSIYTTTLISSAPRHALSFLRTTILRH